MGMNLPAGVKYVKITNNGADSRQLILGGNDVSSWLHLSQLAVYDVAGNNVARNQATLSSAALYHDSAPASIAVDGTLAPRPSGGYWHGSTEKTAFWQVTLAAPTTVSKIVFYNRSDCCTGRALSYILTLLDSSNRVITILPFSEYAQIITFNFADLAGPAGAAGAAGPTGAGGAAGATGAAGAAGATGPAGISGAAGAAGTVGVAGAAGAVGAVGATGPQGTAGAKGDQGLMGMDALEDGPDATYDKTSLGSAKYT